MRFGFLPAVFREVAIDDAAVVGSNSGNKTTSAAVTALGTCAGADSSISAIRGRHRHDHCGRYLSFIWGSALITPSATILNDAHPARIPARFSSSPRLLTPRRRQSLPSTNPAQRATRQRATPSLCPLRSTRETCSSACFIAARTERRSLGLKVGRNFTRSPTRQGAHRIRFRSRGAQRPELRPQRSP